MSRSCAFFVPLLLLGLFCDQGCKPIVLVPEKSEPAAAKSVVFLSADGRRPMGANQRRLLTSLIAGQAPVNLQLLTMDANQTAKVQAEQMVKTVAGRPFAILIEPVAGMAEKSAIQEAVKAGVLVIGLGDSALGLGCTTVLFTDEAEAGRLAGKGIALALQKRSEGKPPGEIQGRVVEIRGDETSAKSTRRHEGFEEALKAAPGLIVVHDAPGGWTKAGGAARTLDALRLQQSFDAVYAHNDLMAAGSAQAAGPLRKQIFIIGNDGFQGADGGLDLLSRGEIDATVQQPLLVDLAWALMIKKLEEPGFKPKPQYQVPARILDVLDVREGRAGTAPPFPAF